MAPRRHAKPAVVGECALPVFAGTGLAALPPDPAWRVPGPPPVCAVRPSDLGSVQAMVRAAAAQGLALVPRSGGTQDGWGGEVRRPPVAVDCTGLSGIVRYDPGDLTVRVRAGTPLDELAHTLAANGQEVALRPPGAARATVGGVLAGDAWGPERASAGGPRDLALGLRVVDGRGRALATGGDVVKNVSGLDAGKLFIGSFGTLGLITEASLRLRPSPEVRLHRAVLWPDAGEAWGAAAGLAAVQPAGAAVCSGAQGCAMVVELAGAKAAVAEQASRYAALCAGGEALSEQEAEGLWGRACEPVSDAPVVRCDVPPARAHDAWVLAEGLHPGADLVAWWGTGALWVRMTGDPSTGAVERLRAAVSGIGGRVAVAAWTDRRRPFDPWGDPGPVWPWLRSVKARLDPDAVFSPGRFVGGM